MRLMVIGRDVSSSSIPGKLPLPTPVLVLGRVDWDIGAAETGELERKGAVAAAASSSFKMVSSSSTKSRRLLVVVGGTGGCNRSSDIENSGVITEVEASNKGL